jgi:APA family basic amino acid/polyamine antiporter
MVGATAIMLVLLAYRVQTTWPGLLIVISGVPIYFFWKLARKKSQT